MNIKKTLSYLLLFTFSFAYCQNYFYLKNTNEKFLNVYNSDIIIEPELFTTSNNFQKIPIYSDFAEIHFGILGDKSKAFIAYPNDTIYLREDQLIESKKSFEDNYDEMVYKRFIPVNNYEMIKSYPMLAKRKIDKDLESTYIESMDSLNYYYKTKKISNEFYTYKSASYYYMFLSLLLVENNQNLFAKHFKDSILINENLLRYSEYRVFYKDYFEYKYVTKNQKIIQTLNTVDKNVNGKFKDLLLNYYIKDCNIIKKITKNELTILSDSLQSYIREKCFRNANLVIPKNKTILQNKLEKNKELYSVLAENKGKVIYIDFWASWCAPCKESLPHTLSLQEHYKDKNFSVIYISIDEDFTIWTNAERNNNLLNQNSYLLLNPKENEWLKSLNLLTIPRYLLYDKDGNLIENDAYSPENEELKSQIDILLGQ